MKGSSVLEVVRCACRPKCARRVRIGEELGLVGGVTQGVLGLAQVDGRQQVVAIRDDRRRQGLVQVGEVLARRREAAAARRGWSPRRRRYGRGGDAGRRGDGAGGRVDVVVVIGVERGVARERGGHVGSGG
eukprot:scaffold63822_cov30-Phaeocystis_antarctica.AAC.1